MLPELWFIISSLKFQIALNVPDFRNRFSPEKLFTSLLEDPWESKVLHGSLLVGRANTFLVSYDFKISLRDLNQLCVSNSDTAGRRIYPGGGIQ